MDPDWIAIRFIDEEVEPVFDKPPAMSKKPGAPAGFKWNDEVFQVETLVSTWFDFQRRGNMTRNMRPANLRKAQRRGSWGVGRYYFRLETSQGRCFDLYYDRAPKNAGDRLGHWFLFRELKRLDPSDNQE
jgi:hypothetical protein